MDFSRNSCYLTCVHPIETRQNPLLDALNYAKGFLVDEELMAGVTENPENPGSYIAFVLRHSSGEYLGYQPFDTLDLALDSINRIPRPWAYERFGGCGGCSDGTCQQGKCGGAKCGNASGPCAVNLRDPNA